MAVVAVTSALVWFTACSILNTAGFSANVRVLRYVTGAIVKVERQSKAFSLFTQLQCCIIYILAECTGVDLALCVYTLYKPLMRHTQYLETGPTLVFR